MTRRRSVLTLTSSSSTAVSWVSTFDSPSRYLNRVNNSVPSKNSSANTHPALKPSIALPFAVSVASFDFFAM